MEQGESTTEKKRNVILLVVALITVCVIAVVVPTAIVLTGTKDDDEANSRSSSNGENPVELSDLVEEVEDGLSLTEHQGADVFRTEENTLLSELYPLGRPLDVLLEEEDMVSNSTNATNATTYYNNTSQTKAPTTAPTTASVGTDQSIAAPLLPQIAATVRSYQVLDIIDHDVNAFTQGLTFDPQNNDIVYESTGLVGHSSVRQVNISTGEVILLRKTPSTVFGEGLAYYTEATRDNPSAGRLIHITWQSQRGFIFDADTLEQILEFEFFTERNQGWGITYNPRTDQFIVTDGSNYLHFWDRDLNEVAKVPVEIQLSDVFPANPVFNLNEIEWDDDTQTVLSNVWQTDWIVRIDPFTGRVVTQYDMSELYIDRIPYANVLNGIAISGNKDLWVTGKKWPNMYRMVFDE